MSLADLVPGIDVAAMCEQLRDILKSDTVFDAVSQEDRLNTAGMLAVLTTFRDVTTSTENPNYDEKDRMSDLDWVFGHLLKLPPSIPRCHYLGHLGLFFDHAQAQQEDTLLLQKAEKALQAAIELPDPSLDSIPDPDASNSLPIQMFGDHQATFEGLQVYHVHALGSIKQRLYETFRELRYLEEALKLLEGCWADATDGSDDNMLAGLKLVKCYDSLHTRTGDSSLLQKGMPVLEKILQSDTYRTRALVLQCGFRLRLWQSRHDDGLLDEGIKVAETIRPEVDHDQIPIHLGNLIGLYIERSFISNDIGDVENAIKLAKDVLEMSERMQVGPKISETDKLIAQAKALAEYGYCIMMRHRYTQDHAFLYEAVRIAAKAIPMTQRLGNQYPNAIFHQLQLATLRCHLSQLSGEERGLTESIEWMQHALRTSRTTWENTQVQSALLECMGTRYCRDVERYNGDIEELKRLGSLIRSVSGSSNVPEVLLAVYRRNGDLEVLNQAIRLNPGKTGDDRLILAQSLLKRTQRLHGQIWTEDAEMALEHLKPFFSGKTINHITFFLATSELSTPIFISSGKLEMSFLASTTKKAVHELPKLLSLGLTREDMKKNLSLSIGLATTAAASALAAGQGADEALELLEAGRGILATYLLDPRLDRLQASSVKLSEEGKILASLVQEKLVELERCVQSDSEISPEYRTNVGRAHELKLEIDRNLKRLQAGKEEVMPLFRPPKAAEMKDCICDGAIVVVNAAFRSNAIIVYKSKSMSLSLPRLTLDGLKWALRCLRLLRGQPAIPRIQKLRGPLSGLLLAWIWKVAVEPILDHLGFTSTPPPGESWPRVWWVLTGNLSQLPFHAAGIHTPGSTSSALDRVISSYSSSINALMSTRENLRNKRGPRNPPDPMVVVPISKTKGLRDLLFVEQEASTIKAVFEHDQSVVVNSLTDPRKEDVLESLRTCNIFHFAGHGASFIEDPDRGCLYLKDGKDNPLTVRDVLNLNLRHTAPWLAYLSACSTGTNQPNALRDEGVHLVAAYQLAGFQHVVGSFWEVSDSRSEIVARSFYRHLKCTGIGEGNDVALALHLAIQELRGHRSQATQSFDVGTATPDPGDQCPTTSLDTHVLDAHDAETMNNDDDGDHDDDDDAYGDVLNVLRGGVAPGYTQGEWDELHRHFEDESRDADRVKRQGSSGGRKIPDPMFWATYFHVGL